MKFWNSIYEYQIDTKIEREELEAEQTWREYYYNICEVLGVVKFLNWMIKIINKFTW